VTRGDGRAGRDVTGADLRRSVEAFLASHPRRSVAAAGTWWEYVASGSGDEVVLLLPGGLGLPELAFGQILDLDGEYRVLAPAYPAITRMSHLVDGVVGLLQAEGVESAHVIGGSYGGQVAQCLVRAYPSRVRSLVLSHTGVPVPARAARMRRALRLFGVLPPWTLRLLLRRRLKELFRGAGEHQGSRSLMDGLLRRITKAELLSLYACAIDFDANYTFSPEDLAGWNGRVLIIGSDDDPLYPGDERAQLEALYPGATLHAFHGTGHLSSVLHPDEYRGVVAEFLRRA